MTRVAMRFKVVNRFHPQCPDERFSVKHGSTVEYLCGHRFTTKNVIRYNQTTLFQKGG